MPEIVTDGQIPQTPLPGAEEAYSRRTNPGLGAYVLSTLGDAGTAFLSRAAERGAVPGASMFDQGLAGANAFEASAAGLEGQITETPNFPAPAQSPTLPPEQYNDLYAPRDINGKVVPIGDKPMPEALAKIIGQQKADAMQRESVLSRYYETHSGVTSFAVGSIASMLDPLNAGSLFLPGIGEAAIATRLGGGLAANIGARAVAGASTGLVMQAPLSAIKMGLAPEEASEYGMREAMRDLAYSAAGVALLHTGIGTAGELLGRAAGRTGIPSDAGAILGADAATKNAAMRGAIGEIADGRTIDVEPIVEAGASPRNTLNRIDALTNDRLAAERGEASAGSPVRTFSSIAADEEAIRQQGWAPGVSQDELVAANDAVYGPKTAEQKAAAPSTAEANPELAAAEEHIAQVPPESLHPDDRAELVRTAEAVEQAPGKSTFYDKAAACLAGLVG